MKNENISQRIRALRKERKITQAGLAKLVGVSHVAISQWERGETEPNGENLLALSFALGRSPHYIAKGISDDLQEKGHYGQDTDDYVKVNPRERILLQLFEELPENEADALLKSLEDKKRHYDELYEELSKKRHGKAS